ncbi:MAG: ABC transporter substrate-binding protein [Deltaproteobacteria bacterium]|nr:ABC transporter substrate-binding protein [Deltaproteobacteria bacterium]
MKKFGYWSFSLIVLFCWVNIAHAKTLNVVCFGADVPGITSLDQSFDPDSYTVITQIFDSLVHLDLDGKRIPGLATSWKLVYDKTYEFDLRKGVKFHNGEDFDASAVKFTYEKVADPAAKTGNAWILNTIQEVKIVDPYKVQIKLKQPDGMFLFRLSMFGSIAPPKYIQQVGMDGFNKKPVGTGPFKFVEWEKGKKIVLEKNPNYWQAGMPSVDQLIFDIIPADQSVDALLSGKVDLVTNINPKDMEKINANPKYKTMKRLVLQGYWVMLKNKGPLANVTVRKALNYAVNKDNLIKVQGGGLGLPLASLGKKGELGKNNEITPYPYDVAKAKSLLAEAGYANGFTIKALSIKEAAPLSQAIVDDLAKIGVKVDMELVSRPEWAKRVVVARMQGNPYPGDMTINLVDNPIVDLDFHAGLFLASSSPWSLINDPEYDKKFTWSLLVPSLGEHLAALQQVDKYIHDNAMMIFTFQPERVFGLKKEITIPNIGLTGHDDYFVFSQAN